MRKFEQGHYTATDVRWEMTLDLSSADNQSVVDPRACCIDVIDLTAAWSYETTHTVTFTYFVL